MEDRNKRKGDGSGSGSGFGSAPKKVKQYGVGPYICPHCQSMFKSTQALGCHNRVHKKENAAAARVPTRKRTLRMPVDPPVERSAAAAVPERRLGPNIGESSAKKSQDPNIGGPTHQGGNNVGATSIGKSCSQANTSDAAHGGGRRSAEAPSSSVSSLSTVSSSSTLRTQIPDLNESPPK